MSGSYNLARNNIASAKSLSKRLLLQVFTCLRVKPSDNFGTGGYKTGAVETNQNELLKVLLSARSGH